MKNIYIIPASIRFPMVSHQCSACHYTFRLRTINKKTRFAATKKKKTSSRMMLCDFFTGLDKMRPMVAMCSWFLKSGGLGQWLNEPVCLQIHMYIFIYIYISAPKKLSQRLKIYRISLQWTWLPPFRQSLQRRFRKQLSIAAISTSPPFRPKSPGIPISHRSSFGDASDLITIIPPSQHSWVCGSVLLDPFVACFFLAEIRPFSLPKIKIWPTKVKCVFGIYVWLTNE